MSPLAAPLPDPIPSKASSRRLKNEAEDLGSARQQCRAARVCAANTWRNIRGGGQLLVARAQKFQVVPLG